MFNIDTSFDLKENVYIKDLSKTTSITLGSKTIDKYIFNL